MHTKNSYTVSSQHVKNTIPPCGDNGNCNVTINIKLLW